MHGAQRYQRKLPFFWTTALGKILIGENLIRRGITLVDWCCMYRCGSKTVNHLPVHYIVACELWAFIFPMFGVKWVMLKRVTDVLVGWHS